MATILRWSAASAAALVASAAVQGDGPTAVGVMRRPSGGLQPQAVVAGGAVHIVFFRGEPQAGDRAA